MKLTFEEFRQMYYNASTETRQTLRERHKKFAAKAHLLEAPGLKEGSTVFICVRKHSRTGFSKTISVLEFAIRTDAGYNATPQEPRIQPLDLTYNVANLLGYNVHEHEGRTVIRTDDYAQEFVCHLSQALFGVEKPNALKCEVL